jgi:hypothetical protein
LSAIGKKNHLKENDTPYLDVILGPIRTCANYSPRFGQGNKKGAGLTLEQFQDLYGTDPFYKWFGLDHPMIYTAHKAAGGMTSIYRQIGIGCERLFRAILRDSLGLSDEDVTWSYQIDQLSGKRRTLQLDGRVVVEQISDKNKQARFLEWMKGAAEKIGVAPAVISSLNGAVFEVRQGYKSKDSKRQNADIANAATAYTQGYLPCAAVLSTQVDKDVLNRYRREKWVVLTGAAIATNDPLTSTYEFMRSVIGYDLAGFFERNSETLRKEIKGVLEALLKPLDQE